MRCATVGAAIVVLLAGFDTTWASADTVNSPPNAPAVTIAFSTACGTATAPTPVTDGAARRYSGTATDPDGDSVFTLLEIIRSDGTLAHSAEVGPTSSGSSFFWPEVPAGALAHGQTYRFRARSRDSVSTGPYSRECFLTVDAVRPGVPRIESTDYPDGAAVLPLTVFENPVPTATLFVQAVDRAGNVSQVTPGWGLSTFDNPAPQAHERGDMTGDGRADVTTVLDHGFGRTLVWNVTARDGGFYAGTAGFDGGINGGVPPGGIRHVRGDFDGDGRTDVAIFRQLFGGAASLILLRSDGNRYGATTVWDSGSEAVPLTEMRVLSGDFDADGKSDIAAQLGLAGGGWRVLVFRGGALGVPATWISTGPAGGDWAHATLVAGDADGDGLADLIEMRDQGRCRTTNWVYRSSGTAFTGGVLRWDSGPGGYCAHRSTPVTGDVDGDGRDDIVASYRHRATDTAMIVFTSANGFTPREWWRRPAEFDATLAVLSTGDFDLDGKDDLAVIYPGRTSGQTQLWTLRSTGTTFANRVLAWQEQTGGTPARFGP